MSNVEIFLNKSEDLRNGYLDSLEIADLNFKKNG